MFDAELEAALKHAQPYQQLRALVLALKSQGQNQRQVYDVFEKFRAQLREADREADEDFVMETMNDIIGWCAPHQCLFDEYLET